MNKAAQEAAGAKSAGGTEPAGEGEKVRDADFEEKKKPE
jgi:hypothetical protein